VPYAANVKLKLSCRSQRSELLSGQDGAFSAATVGKHRAILVKPDEGRSFGRAPVMLGADVWQIIDSVPAFVWCASPDGSIEFLNQRGLAYTGFSSGQIRGWQWKDTNILHPDDMQRLFEEWSAIVASGQEGEIQARMKRFDGEYKWFLFRVAPLKIIRDDSLGGWA
jgi:PAS domain S-box-containing protein